MSEPVHRTAVEADAERLVAVYRSAYRANRDLGFPMKAASATVEEVATWIRDHRVEIAAVEGEVVAGVRLETTHPDRLKLSRVGVHDDWKGQGVGSGLLDHVERVAREQGYGTVWLTTPPEHPFLLDLYRDRGYAVTGEHPLDFRDYDEVVMEKSLTDPSGG